MATQGIGSAPAEERRDPRAPAQRDPARDHARDLAKDPAREVARDQHWTAYGLCAAQQPDELFVEGAAQRAARQLCLGCAVRLECLVDALDHHVAFGVWGGMTERERRALLRRRPEVDSWREVVEAEPEMFVPPRSRRDRRRRR